MAITDQDLFTSLVLCHSIVGDVLGDIVGKLLGDIEGETTVGGREVIGVG
tara:strand:- start:538 stop:687 length:150 start_codon:yes stop_codon:yes gene_type:complete